MTPLYENLASSLSTLKKSSSLTGTLKGSVPIQPFPQDLLPITEVVKRPLSGTQRVAT